MDATTYFYLTHFTGILVTGAAIFLGGVFLAWLLWRHRRDARKNGKFRAEIEALEKEIAELERV